jgi:hypothetical protein
MLAAVARRLLTRAIFTEGVRTRKELDLLPHIPPHEANRALGMVEELVRIGVSVAQRRERRKLEGIQPTTHLAILEGFTSRDDGDVVRKESFSSGVEWEPRADGNVSEEVGG